MPRRGTERSLREYAVIGERVRLEELQKEIVNLYRSFAEFEEGCSSRSSNLQG